MLTSTVRRYGVERGSSNGEGKGVLMNFYIRRLYGMLFQNVADMVRGGVWDLCITWKN